MSTTGTSLGAGLQSGARNAIASIRASSDAAVNVGNVALFTKLIKKAEDNAQSAL